MRSRELRITAFPPTTIISFFLTPTALLLNHPQHLGSAMSYAQSSPFPPAFEPYSNDYAKQDVLQGGFDFYSFNSPADNLAPHPDLLEFENELDSTLAGFDATGLELLTVDSNDAFTTLRTDTPTCGPPSISSESASQYSSIYNYARTSYSSNNNYSPFPLGLEMELQRFKFDPVADYTGVQSTDVGGDPSVDPNSFGALPPTPPRSPATRTLNNPKGYPVRSSFSDYGPSTRSPEYYSPVNYTSPMGQPTVSPSHVTTQLPVVPSISLLHPADDYKGDPRKKYKCHVCPRGIHFFL